MANLVDYSESQVGPLGAVKQTLNAVRPSDNADPSLLNALDGVTGALYGQSLYGYFSLASQRLLQASPALGSRGGVDL
ncbi:MAG: hypothetical protein M1836_000739 [Candelina mexicana]|nr:MAG: hypothetical protein M1836_000739 [Candelina mexicana]